MNDVTTGNPGGHAAVQAFARKVARSLNETAQPFVQGSGLSPEAVAQINQRVTEHLGNLMVVQAGARPGKLKSLARVNVRWEDFGDEPVEAYMDHERQTITLNPKVFLNANAKATKQGKVLRTVTHEFSHQLDRVAGNGEAAFTQLFEPMHGFLSQYEKALGAPQWMLDSKIAYPLSGYFGMAGKYTESLPKEYVAVISELYWHDRDQLDTLDAHFAQIGYHGPSMRETMDRVWGTTMPKGNPRPLSQAELTPVDTAAYGIRKAKPAVKWNPGSSRKDALGRIVN